MAVSLLLSRLGLSLADQRSHYFVHAAKPSAIYLVANSSSVTGSGDMGGKTYPTEAVTVDITEDPNVKSYLDYPSSVVASNLSRTPVSDLIRVFEQNMWLVPF